LVHKGYDVEKLHEGRDLREDGELLSEQSGLKDDINGGEMVAARHPVFVMDARLYDAYIPFSQDGRVVLIDMLYLSSNNVDQLHKLMQMRSEVLPVGQFKVMDMEQKLLVLEDGIVIHPHAFAPCHPIYHVFSGFCLIRLVF